VAVRLIDTNIVSFLLKAHPLATKYQPHLNGFTLAISFMTVAEMREGAALANWGARRLASLETTLHQFLILHADDTVCKKWAEIRTARRSHPIGVADAWLAATSLAHGLDLITHDAADFHGILGLTIITEAP